MTTPVDGRVERELRQELSELRREVRDLVNRVETLQFWLLAAGFTISMLSMIWLMKNTPQ